ncbi:MAG: DUF924 family protein [Pseudomonadota bacterium]
MSTETPVDQVDVPPRWAEDVLAYWFKDLDQAAWFGHSDAVDATIRDRFYDIWEWCAKAPVHSLRTHPDVARAAIIVLDQFSRNLFRDSAQAFDNDDRARQIAEFAIEQGWDTGLSVDEALFVYLPFEHSEDLVHQERSVELIRALGNDQYTDFAVRHHDTVARFGRFPHRNDVLGRDTTPAEAAFLETTPRGF